MKLYYMPGACSLAPHIALEWTGAPYEGIRVTFPETKTPAFLAMNPSGAVPVLVEDDGWVLTENVAILDHLARRFPAAGIGDNGEPRDRATLLRWLAHLASDVHKAFGPIMAPASVVPDPAQHAAVKQTAREKVQRLMARIDTALAGRTTLHGERHGIADAYLFVMVRWTEHLAGGLAQLPNLVRFRDAMQADPGVQRALAAEGLA